MHSSNDAKLTRTHWSQHTCASLFSFPPTQRKGLLGPTALKRSSDQTANLEQSFRNLLFALNMAPMQQYTA